MGIARSVFAWLLVVVGLAATPAPDALGAPVPQRPDPMVAKWPHWPYLTRCGSGLAFDPVSVFSGPTEAEVGLGPAEEGLRKTIEEWQTGYPTLPEHHWRLLGQESGVVVFGHGRLPGVEELTLEESKGVWAFSGYGGCEPTSIVDGRQAITWTLSSKQSRLRPDTRRLWIDLGPGECASGRSQNARAMKPVFFELGNRLLMIMRLKPLPPGNYTCEGIFEPPLRVKLPRRLGNRTLFDGGVYPPTRAVLPRRG